MSGETTSRFCATLRAVAVLTITTLVWHTGANSVAAALIIVNDTWRDGTDDDPAAPVYSEFGTDSDADGDIESAWFQGGGGTLNPVGPGGPLRGSGYGGVSASWTTYFAPEYSPPDSSPITLALPGQSLKVTWVFTTGDVNTSNTSQNFRVALVESPSATRVVANATPGSGAYAGYALFGNMGETTGNANSFQLRERSASGDLLATSGNWTALANGLGTGAVGYSDNTQYTFVMTLTRTPASALDISMSITGGNIGGTGTVSVNFTDATPSTFSYDTFAIRPSNATTTSTLFDTHLFRVEFVPEPSSMVLLGLAGAVLLSLRRGSC